MSFTVRGQRQKVLVQRNEATASTSKQDEDKPLTLVDARWELIDPTPDVHALFVEFDRRYFNARLGAVALQWSTRMTLWVVLDGVLCEFSL